MLAINPWIDEAQLYKQRFDESMLKFENARRPHFALMRHTAIYETKASRDKAIAAIQNVLGQFENLFRNIGGVTNGFPAQTPLSELVNRDEYNAEMLEENLLFGSPEQAIEKLKKYQQLGVDSFIYYASMGLDHHEQIKSLELFCNKVLPAFANPSGQHLKKTGWPATVVAYKQWPQSQLLHQRASHSQLLNGLGGFLENIQHKRH